MASVDLVHRLQEQFEIDDSLTYQDQWTGQPTSPLFSIRLGPALRFKIPLFHTRRARDARRSRTLL